MQVDYTLNISMYYNLKNKSVINTKSNVFMKKVLAER
jgi:hypothetical protein